MLSAIYASLSYVANVTFFIVECGIARFLCSMRVFEVRSSSSSPRLPLCQISFLSKPVLMSKPREKNRILNQSLTQSLSHSPSLFDAPGAEALTLLKIAHFSRLQLTTQLLEELSG